MEKRKNTAREAELKWRDVEKWTREEIKKTLKSQEIWDTNLDDFPGIQEEIMEVAKEIVGRIGKMNLIKTPKNIVLDVGGILIGFRWSEMLKEYGLSEEQSRYFASTVFEDPLWREFDLENEPFDAVVQQYLEKYPDLAEISRFFFGHPERMMTPRPKVWDRVRSLKKAGYRIYLLSNYSSHLFRAHTKDAGFWPYIDGKVISWEVHRIKPYKEIYEALFDRYGLRPDECLFIDDMPANVQGGFSVGMPSILAETETQVLLLMDHLLARKADA